MDFGKRGRLIEKKAALFGFGVHLVPKNHICAMQEENDGRINFNRVRRQWVQEVVG